MPAKHPAPVTPKQLVNNIHASVRAYIEAGNGKVINMGSIEIVPRIGMEFAIVIRCIGTRPKWSS